MHLRAVMTILILLALAVTPVRADEALAQQILKELIDVNTAPSGGNDMSEAIALLDGHLRAAGFDDDDITIVDGPDGIQHMVVRFSSPRPQHEPILMMAHLDVVEGLREDWSFEPYNMIERDGYFYGRGTVDNKAGAAIIVANLVRMKREGYRPNRDLIAMLTGDEETTGAGANWLATEGRELIDAEYALNSDGGGVILEDGEETVFVVQTAEKVYVSYRLQAVDPGGHSSRPRPDNPIYRIARALAALQQHAFPLDLNETTQQFFAHRAMEAPAEELAVLEPLAAGDLDDAALASLPEFPYYNALARATCVATQLDGGHAENALPQSATAVVNCRVLPQMPIEEVERTLANIVAPFDLELEQIAPTNAGPPSPLSETIVEPIRDVATELWPGIDLVPQMSTGATDGLFLRAVGIPVYGVSALAADPAENRAHGKDERVRVESFNNALTYWYRLTRHLTGG
ncbi:MAG: M20/M25/M40 family metallo-hydrolase [Woeseiaceae bacterium]|nr:M20/M25/M40 family metallo-hydrolase [Woeseiaceae bacterium]